jgi:hypothetical protein
LLPIYSNLATLSTSKARFKDFGESDVK